MGIGLSRRVLSSFKEASEIRRKGKPSAYAVHTCVTDNVNINGVHITHEQKRMIGSLVFLLLRLIHVGHHHSVW